MANENLKNYQKVLLWIFYFPLSILAAFIIPGIMFAIVSSYDLNEGSFMWHIYRLVQSGAFGWFFVSAAGYLAPQHKLVVSIVNLVILAIFTGIVIMSLLQGYGESLSYLHILAALVGGVVGLFWIKEEFNI